MMECFAVYADEIEGRIDPHYYKPEFIKLEEQLLRLYHKKLGDMIEFSSEIWNQKDIFENKFPYIEISKIDISSGEIQNISYYEKSKAPSRAKMIVRENDIIISTTRPHRGAIVLIDKDKDGFIVSTGFTILRGSKINFNRQYLLFFLRTKLSLKQMLKRSSGGNYPAITSDELKKLVVPLPPLPIQNHIVKIMDNAYKIKKQKETETQQLLDSFEQFLRDEKVLDLKKITQEKMFSINLNDLDDAFNPERYANQIQYNSSADWVQINNIGHIYRNTFTPEKTNPEEMYTLMRIDDLDNNPISAVTRILHGKDVNGTILKVKTNDVLIARLGPTIENKKFILAPKSQHDLISSNEFICLRCNKNNKPTFILELLKTDFYKKLMIQKTRGATPSRRRLSHEDFSKLPFPEIDIKIQNKIAEEVKRRMQKAEILQKEAKQLLQEAKEKVEKIIFNYTS